MSADAGGGVPYTVTAVLQEEPKQPQGSTAATMIPSPAGGESQQSGGRKSITGAQQNQSGSGTPPVPILKKQQLKKKKSASQPVPHISAAEPPAEGETTDRIRLGICAMDKKARSKPMAEILSRLDETQFHVIFFGDDMIRNKTIEEWPLCDVLIAFFSKGYPLQKAKEYVALRKPFILNDLEMQEHLKDRRCVYDLLEKLGIDVPRHAYLSRDDYVSTGSGDGDGSRARAISEYDDHIEVNGIILHKPFVEKPVDADDHNIAIYYPSSAGGGCKKLFRKIGNRSSEFYPDVNEVRRDGSYIYEEFVVTQGTDVKMYTVGPEYGHAEARKSPTVDGKVQRNADGKEVRFPVILTLREKEIARRIVLGFKQFVCGFDLLRVQEGHSVVSYCCDVNGWSFVKNSRKYYDDCAQIMTEHILAAVRPANLIGFSTLDPLVTTSANLDDHEVIPFHRRATSTLSRVARMLQGEVSVSVDDVEKALAAKAATTVEAISPSEQSVSPPANAATTLEEGAIPVREIPDQLASQPASICPSTEASVDESEHAKKKNNGKKKNSISCGPNEHPEELRCVIAVVRHGDRTPKQKLKVNMTEPMILKYFHDHAENPRKDLKIKDKVPMIEFLNTVKTLLKNKTGAQIDEESVSTANTKNNRKVVHQLRHMRDVLERWKIGGLNRKLQIKPREWREEESSGAIFATEVQLVLKWGGNLTKLGEKQAITLGQRFRHDMYPDISGGGILRLHSTFRHDLKIKTSDEGRVMKTAAAFAKGLLELEGEIPPILVSLVHKEKGSMHMLDPSGDKDVKVELDDCKEKITENLQQNVNYREISEEERETMVGPNMLTSMRDALAEIGNPRRTLMEIYKTMGYLIEQLEEMLGLMGSGDERRLEGGEGLQGDDEDDVALSGVKLYKGETLLELTERWKFIYKRLYDPDDDTFDLSRVPDVHDNVRFDVLHNPHLGLTKTLEKLYEMAKPMADCVVPQEYGTSVGEKRSVGVKICSSLLDKIMNDLNIARTDNKADMRYMINMDYSADLPINTMGRRIRTRLYFTSESHLHTMINVLRFAGQEGVRSLLSSQGIDVINNTRELCYLTQIVIRLFEDTSRSMDDLRRFRVEIMFSPGANATPLHMDESDRKQDSARFDTAPLRPIGREGLTCQEVEDFFGSAILESQGDWFDAASQSTIGLGKKPDHLISAPPPKIIESTMSAEQLQQIDDKTLTGASVEGNMMDKERAGLIGSVVAASSMETLVHKNESEGLPLMEDHMGPTNEPVSSSNASSPDTTPAVAATVTTANDITPRSTIEKKSVPDELFPAGSDDDPSKQKEVLAGRYFWGTVAVGSMLLGAGCFVMALCLSDPSRGGRRSSSSSRVR